MPRYVTHALYNLFPTPHALILGSAALSKSSSSLILISCRLLLNYVVHLEGFPRDFLSSCTIFKYARGAHSDNNHRNHYVFFVFARLCQRVSPMDLHPGCRKIVNSGRWVIRTNFRAERVAPNDTPFTAVTIRAVFILLLARREKKKRGNRDEVA